MFVGSVGTIVDVCWKKVLTCDPSLLFEKSILVLKHGSISCLSF